MDCNLVAVWVAPSFEGFVGNLGVQAIGSRWWPPEREPLLLRKFLCGLKHHCY